MRMGLRQATVSACSDRGEGLGRADMRAQDRKLRLALAVFEATVSLDPVLAALLQQGIPLSRIGLILCADYAARLEPETPGPSSGDVPLDVLVRGLRPLSQTASGGPILASPCLLEHWSSGLHLPALWGDTASADGEPRLAPDLERHVKSGSVIVAAESVTPREQWQCMRVLLRQSSSSVLALECALPPPKTDS